MSKYATCEPCGIMDDKTLTARVDIDKVRKVNDVNLGDTVTLTIKGKVRSMRGPDESVYKNDKGKEIKSVYPGSLEIEISDMRIGSVGEFDGLEEDDD